MIALFTAFALLVQAWIPSLAMAAPASAAGMELCTPQGAQSAPVSPTPDQAPASHACQHCICAIPAVDTPTSAAASAPVRYASRVERISRTDPAMSPGRGLAAPPPPSRGPPSLLT